MRNYVEHHNEIRLNSAIGYITPKDMLAGRQQEIHVERDQKLAAAPQQRQIRRHQAASKVTKIRAGDTTWNPVRDEERLGRCLQHVNPDCMPRDGFR